MTYEEILKAIKELSEKDKRKILEDVNEIVEDEPEREEASEETETETEEQTEEESTEEAEAEEPEEESTEEEQTEDEAEAEPEETEEATEETTEEETTEDEATETEEAPAEEAAQNDIDARLTRIEAMLAKLVGGEVKESAAESKAKEIYGLGGGKFTPDSDGEKSSEAKVDVKKTLRNLGL